MRKKTCAGFPDLGKNLCPDDVEKNLEELLQKLRNETDGACLVGSSIANTLSQNRFLQHESTKVRLLTACCIADVFRLKAPDCPYNSNSKLRDIIEFLMQQFEHLQHDDEFHVEKSSYLVASLAKARTLKLCLDLDSGADFVVKIFTHFMAVISSRSSKSFRRVGGVVRRFIVDILASLISEPDGVSDDLINSMKEFLVGRDDSEAASQLCRELIVKASDGLESHMDRFFKSDFGQRRISEMYELFVELYKLVPQSLTCFVLKLDTMLQSKHDNIRMEVTEFVARLMATTDLISSFPSLHKDFLARFNDEKYEIRMKCVEMSLPLLMRESTLREEIVEAIRQRQYDVNESVRFQVVFTILKTAEGDISAVSDLGLLEIVKERTLDTNFKVRRLALMGIGQLYRKFTSRPPPSQGDEGGQSPDWQEDREAASKVEWIRNKVLHRYYQTSLQDRLIVERILHTCLVPFWLTGQERTEKFYQLFTTADENAVKALIQMLKFQHTYRQQLKGMMHLMDENGASDANREKLDALVDFMAQQVSNDDSAKNHILEFLQLVRESPTLHRHTTRVLEAKTYEDVNENVRAIMMTLGDPNGALFATLKQLLERVAPLVTDSAGIYQILEAVREKLECVKEDEGRRCLELLCVLSEVHPDTFIERDILDELCDLLAAKWEAETSDLLLRIVYNLRNKSIEESFPDCASSLKALLLKLLENGTPKQAKLAVRCINCLFEDAVHCFSEALDRLRALVNKATQHMETILVSLGQIAGLRPECFNPHREYITVEIAVKKVLMASQSSRKSKSKVSRSVAADVIPVSTRRKVAAMKLVTYSLVGLANLYCARAPNADEGRKKMMFEFMIWDAECTLRLLFTAVENDGDLMNSGDVSEDEKRHFRLKAGTSILKICCLKDFDALATGTQFRTLVKLVTDPSRAVRERFCEKLHSRLLKLKLPLHFMALLSYGALEPDDDHKERIKGYLAANIKKRREYLKYHSVEHSTRVTILPDNVIGYVIHMLAHDPSFTSLDDVQTLEKIRECLWFQLQFLCCESNGSYSFQFYKKLIETIKRSRDREDPHDDATNTRLYAVCDLALGLIMSRTTNLGRAKSTEKVHLPTKLFVEPAPSTAFNSKYYLPTELTFTPPVVKRTTPATRGKRPPAKPDGTPRRRRRLARTRLQEDESTEEEVEDDDDMDYSE